MPQEQKPSEVIGSAPAGCKALFSSSDDECIKSGTSRRCSSANLLLVNAAADHPGQVTPSTTDEAP